MWPQNEPMHSTIIASFPSSPGAQICIAGVRVYFLHKHEPNQNRTKTERQLRTLMAWEQVKPLASFPGFSTIQFLKALMLQLDGRETGNKCPRNVPLLPCIPDPCSQLPVGTMTSSLTRSSPRRAHSRRCLERSRSWFRAPLMATMSAFLRMDR